MIDDIVGEIALLIAGDPKAYYRCLRVDRQWYKIFFALKSKVKLNEWDILVRRCAGCNIALASRFVSFDLVIEFPEKPWNWCYLSENPNVTFDIVKANPTKPWDYHRLSYNKNIVLDTVIQNPDFPWNYKALLGNPNLKWDIIWSGLGEFSIVLRKSNIELDIDKQMGLKWLCYCELSCNPNVSIDTVRAIPSVWNYFCLSQNVTWEQVLNNPDILWNYEGMSSNKNVTWDIIKSNLDKPWEPYFISKNPNITIDIILQNPSYPWNFTGVSSNKNITWGSVISHPELSWHYLNLKNNANIILEAMAANPDDHRLKTAKFWDWDNILESLAKKSK